MTWGTDDELPPLTEEEIANFSAIRKSTMKGNRGSSAIEVFREKIGDFNADRYFKYRASVNVAKNVQEKGEQNIQQTAANFVGRVNSVNYSNVGNVLQLIDYLDKHNFAPLSLGWNGIYQFVLTPCSAALISREVEGNTGVQLERDFVNPDKPGLDPELVEIILGLNTPVDRRTNRSSEESIQSDRSSGHPDHRRQILERSLPQLRIFAQLGVISCCKIGGLNNLSNPGSKEMTDSGWVLVVDVSIGRAGAVYIVFNFKPYNGEGDRSDWGPGRPGLGPDGLQGGADQGSRFFVGFVANNLTPALFGTTNRFDPQGVCKDRPELVTVRKNRSIGVLYKDPDSFAVRSAIYQSTALASSTAPALSRSGAQRASEGEFCISIL